MAFGMRRMSWDAACHIKIAEGVEMCPFLRNNGLHGSPLPCEMLKFHRVYENGEIFTLKKIREPFHLDMALDTSLSGPKHMETDELPVNSTQPAIENAEAKDMTETSISEPVDVDAGVTATTIDASLSNSGNVGASPSPDLGHLKGLNESRTQLLSRVQALKKDLESWRGKPATQVKSYRVELGHLRSSLNSEVEQLRVHMISWQSGESKYMRA